MGVAGLFETLVLTHHSTQHNIVNFMFSITLCLSFMILLERKCLPEYVWP